MLIIPPIRGNDAYGSGFFGASRGHRKHNGVDVACYKGSEILSVTPGVVTKIGYPYRQSDAKKKHYRYVEVTQDGKRFRYFYISPLVSKGDVVQSGTVLGIAQGLLSVYPSITDHIHVEIKLANDRYEDPTGLIANGSLI